MYKDINEELQNSLFITRIVFSLDKHKTLEDAYNDNLIYEPGIDYLGQDRIETKLQILPYEQYTKVKTQKNYVGDEN